MDRTVRQVALWLRRRTRAACAVVPLLAVTAIAAAVSGPPPAATASDLDLTELTLEDLMDIEVTSVSKRAQKRSEVAAAIAVITRDDIRRSGATSIADALRLVPGVQVARINTSIWAISARGFNSRFANKLLVLVDGRSVYTPLFSGVFWDAQDTVLEDIDRIEVIRGPGASIWGANAVNGVINIITRHAVATQGGLLVASAGNEERGTGVVRYGGRRGDDLHYRVYAKYLERDRGVQENGVEAFDDWNVSRGGFRLDWKATRRDRFMLRGEIHDGSSRQCYETYTFAPADTLATVTADAYSGHDVLGLWERTISPRSIVSFQVYHDHTDRQLLGAKERRHTYDVELRHQLGAGRRHQIVWGLGFRDTRDEIDSSPLVVFDERRHDHQLLNLFLQDEIDVVAQRLQLTFGAKYEAQSHTDAHAQPTVRLSWAPHTAHRIWAAWSHAHRTPSRVERSVRVNGPVEVIDGDSGLAAELVLFGDEDLEVAHLTAYELGYRAQLGRRTTIDATGFLTDYQGLVGYSDGRRFAEVAPPPLHVVVPLYFDNNADARTWGVELAVERDLATWWRLRAAYSFLRVDFDAYAQATTLEVGDPEGESPRHQGHAWATLDLPAGLGLDAVVSYVDALPAVDVDAYWNLDLRLGWQAGGGVELSLVGRNLLADRHLEFRMAEDAELGFTHAEVERGVHAQLAWRF